MDEQRQTEQKDRCSCQLNILPMTVDPDCKWHRGQLLQKQACPVEQKDKPAVWDLVVQDMVARNQQGIEKYGTPLQTFNGRNALWDAYQEALDLVVYLRQRIEEDYEKESRPQ